MSVQLIVYPQNYEGYNANISTASNNFIVDGTSFIGVNFSSDHTITLSNGTQEAIDFYGPALVVNTWKRYHEGVSGVSESGGLVTINPKSGQVQQGLIQKLSNLTVGNWYDIVLDISSIIDTTNAFGISIFSGTNLQQVLPIPTTTGLVTIPFNAFSVDDTIVILGNSNIDQILILNSISVIDSSPIPTGAVQILGDGQVICDLYEDEDIPLTLSVDNFTNAAEKVQSYSKAFKLPATKRNNRIFDQMFEITREVDSKGGLMFNPYKKTKAVLKQNGFILFEGYLRMLNITDKKGEISYNVNLYSEVIALADTLKEKTFRDLDFSELAHEYNYTNIRNSWQGILPVAPLPPGSFAGPTGATITGVLKYPFVDWNHQFSYTNSGMPKLANLESAFRPFIKLKYLIKKIFADSDFTFDSTFFTSLPFDKLFMDFNWGSESQGAAPLRAGALNQAYNFDSGVNFYIDSSSYQKFKMQETVSGNNSLWDNTEYKFVSDVNNLKVSGSYLIKLYNSSGSDRGNSLRFSHFNANGAVLENFYINHDSISGNGYKSQNASYSCTMNTGDYLQVQSKVSTDNIIRISTLPPLSNLTFNYDNDASTVVELLQNLRGDTNQWEFLKGLITMFNLVTIPDEDNPNNIKIEPYKDIFINSSDSVQLDWTEKIDITEIKLTPLIDLNKRTIFKFVEDDEDYIFNQYKNSVGNFLYGSYTSNAGTEFTILTGEEEVIADPFAATIVKPLFNLTPPLVDELIVPTIYSYNQSDDTSESFENSPRIMFNNYVVDMNNTTYSVPAQNGGLGDAVEDQFLQFSHLTDIPTIVTSPPNPSDTQDFHFGECQLFDPIGQATVNNLYKMYWQPYFNELYNPNTRTMTIKVNLSPADINTFKFNDTVFIKNRVFRVNKINYKPNDLATVEFILIP